MGDEHEIEAGANPEVDPEAVAEDVEATDVQLEREEHGEVAAEADDEVHAQAEEQPQPEEVHEDVPVVDADATSDDDVAEPLRAALGTMRQEADRIATLGTGSEQVEAAERFAEDAGRLDEQIGSAARAADDERG